MGEARTEADTGSVEADPRVVDPLLDHAGLEVLDPAECRRLLAASPVARLAFVDHGEPVILPITIDVWDGSVVFSTGPGTKYETALMRGAVAVEVDGWDAERHSGWSVLVKGTATLVEEGREIDALDRLSVKTWVRPEVPKQWVRILANEITGRRVPDASH